MSDTRLPTREDLAVVLWARLLDTAKLTMPERRMIGRFQEIVLSENDALAKGYRDRCLKDVFGG